MAAANQAKGPHRTPGGSSPGRLTRLTDRLVFIERGWQSANHLVDTGPEPALLDTGYLPHLPHTLELIRRAGVEPREVRRIINTHIHCDHVGGNAHIAALSGCRVLVSALERHFVENKNGWATWWDYYGQEGEFFPVHEALEDGGRVEFGGLSWEVLETPGHAMGEISFFAPDTGWLISGDVAWDGDFGLLTTRIEGLDAPFRLRRSLERLSRLPVTLMIPGHGPLIEDGRAAIAKCRERIEAFIADPGRMARDQVRKIILYGLMMRQPVAEKDFQRWLRDAIWWRETSLMHFGGPTEGEVVLLESLEEFKDKGLIKEEDGRLVCTLRA